MTEKYKSRPLQSFCSTSIIEKFHNPVPTFHQPQAQGCKTLLVFSIEICSLIYKDLHYLEMAEG